MSETRTPSRLVGSRPSGWVGAAVSVISVAAATAAIYPLKHLAPTVSLSVVYLPAVLLVSAYWGLALGLATSLMSAAAFNFFHLPPTGRFTISDSRNWVALGAFIIVAVVVSTVAELARTRRARVRAPSCSGRSGRRPRARSAGGIQDDGRACAGGSPRRRGTGDPVRLDRPRRGRWRPAAPRDRAERRRSQPDRDAHRPGRSYRRDGGGPTNPGRAGPGGDRRDRAPSRRRPGRRRRDRSAAAKRRR